MAWKPKEPGENESLCDFFSNNKGNNALRVGAMLCDNP